MRLTEFHVWEYKSIEDSNSIPTSDITCLVGKNESGKTSLLQALYKLNPVVADHGKYDVTDEYPRAEVEDYRQAIEAGDRDPATVVSATFQLDQNEIVAIENAFGKGVLPDRQFIISKKYDNIKSVSMKADEVIAGRALISEAGLDVDFSSIKWTSLKDLQAAWTTLAEQKATAFNVAQAALVNITDPDERKKAANVAAQIQETHVSQKLRSLLPKIIERDLSLYIWDLHIKPSFPKFLYFDEYYQMDGHVNIQQLKHRQANPATLLDSDHPMLGLIELARLQVDELVEPARTEELISKLEGASNHLSKQILKYWSQNKHLMVRFDVRPARPGDPKGLETGTTLLGRVHDSVHLVSTPLGARSKGFVWFFSFVAWFSKQQKTKEPLILLLDEPGLFLHGKAQGDLLQYIEEQLPPHQVIYTTHSPFMVDPARFDRVRIVEDKSMDSKEELSKGQSGTKVYTNVLEVSTGSLFPLQVALGYEISQALFVGPNSLIVEGVSDLLYIQSMSALLQRRSRAGLNKAWTITPVGGSEKVSTFVSLLGAQKGMRVATLIDIQQKDRQQIESLYKRKLLRQQNVLTFADFTGSKEADIEDMFEPEFYLTIVNGEYAKALGKPLAPADLSSTAPRILVRLEKHLEAHPLKSDTFNHYRPARYFVENSLALEKNISTSTLDRFEAAFADVNKLLGK
jgi:predicted ATP-dependent endonuclease of OLD family